MNRSTNKFHRDLRHPTKREMEMSKSNKFDTLPPFVQVAMLASLVLTVPLWGVPYFIHLLITDNERSRKKDAHLNKIVKDAMTLQANQAYLQDHFRKVRADVARREQVEDEQDDEDEYEDSCVEEPDPLDDYDNDAADAMKERDYLDEQEAEESQ